MIYACTTCSATVNKTKDSHMKKLYTKDSTPVITLSAEQFIRYHKTAAVISTENLDVYLSKIKDTFLGVDRLVDVKTERFFKEVDSNRYETISRAKKVKFVNFRSEVVSKPEQFKGYYLEYAEQLNKSGEVITELVDVLLSNLKLAVSTFINEYNLEKSDMMYGSKSFTDGAKILEHEKGAIASYFKAPAGKVRDKVQDLLKSNADFEPIFKEFDTLKKVYTEERHKEIQAHVKSVTELVDVMIDLNIKSNVLNRNDALKRQLMEAIHTTAQVVEFHYAMYAHTVFLAKAFTELTQTLNNFPLE